MKHPQNSIKKSLIWVLLIVFCFTFAQFGHFWVQFEKIHFNFGIFTILLSYFPILSSCALSRENFSYFGPFSAIWVNFRHFIELLAHIGPKIMSCSLFPRFLTKNALTWPFDGRNGGRKLRAQIVDLGQQQMSFQDDRRVRGALADRFCGLFFVF